jgi:hypothetical protein
MCRFWTYDPLSTTRANDEVPPNAASSETALGAISGFSNQRILGQLNIIGSKGYAGC